MQYKRIYLDQALSVTEQITTDKDTGHYLATVLRCRIGDKLILFNGLGGSYVAEITAIAKQAVTISIEEFIPDDMPGSIHITMAYAISKGSHMDYAIQKAVELGVHSIAPLFTARGNVKLDEKRIKTRYEHWRKIIIHACEQSGRNDVPELLLPQALSDWLTQDSKAKKYIFSLHSQNFLYTDGDDLQKCILLLGPEGGFTPEEEQLAVQAGYEPVSLGARTLRTETAVAAAITTVQVLWGDMRARK